MTIAEIEEGRLDDMALELFEKALEDNLGTIAGFYSKGLAIEGNALIEKLKDDADKWAATELHDRDERDSEDADMYCDSGVA